MATVSTGGRGTLAQGWDFKLQYHPAIRIILQKTRKMDRDPYVQIFFKLRDMKEICLKYGIIVHPETEPTRQMVLGTGNQEKEPAHPPPREGSPPTAPELPGASSLYPSMPPYLRAPPPQKPARECPLVETGGEFGPTRIHKPFSLLEQRQIKQDLESYTDDPGKYIDTLQHITLAFDLMWKDIMVIFNQTLSDPEHTRVLKESWRYATGLHMSSDRYPVEETAVPSSDPNWNYNDPEHIWERDHFLICVKAGLKAAQQKVISYVWVSAITQEPNENPVAFLERLKEALQKFTNLDLGFYEGQVILRTNSSPNVHQISELSYNSYSSRTLLPF